MTTNAWQLRPRSCAGSFALRRRLKWRSFPASIPPKVRPGSRAMRSFRHPAPFVWTVLVAASFAATGGSAADRTVGNPAQGRSAVIAVHGMVCTSQPLASLAGVEILRQGGNAADAAIAVDAMLGLVEPASCGMGGDLFVFYWDAKTKKLYGLNASGRSPYALTREVFAKKNLHEIPGGGPLSWSVPGCVSGWDALHTRF